MTKEKIAMSITEVAETLSLGRTKIYQEIGAGRLQAVKCGKRTLVTRGSVDDWLMALKPICASQESPKMGNSCTSGNAGKIATAISSTGGGDDN